MPLASNPPLAPKKTRFYVPANSTRSVPLEPVGSHIIPLDGRWENGHPLEVPRDRLPELLAADLVRIISDCETARWLARPSAAKGSAAA